MRRRSLGAAFTAAFTAAVLAGCALEQPPRHADLMRDALPETTSVPPAWTSHASISSPSTSPASTSEADAAPVADDWLASLDDPRLTAIVAEALAHNPDLRQAVEAVTIAQQSVVVVGAQLLPQIDGQLGALTARSEHEDGYLKTSSAYATVAWELDVWGRLRAQRAAAEAGFEATALDYARARQSLAATVAKAWYVAIETRQLLALAEQSVGIYSELLRLVMVRRDAGKDTDLDVYDTRAKLQSARSEVHAAQQNQDEARRALEVLLGRYPAAEIDVAADYPLLSPPPAAGLPASLLERRPDVLSAERDVLVAFRLEESARLALLPDVSIGLVGGRLGSLTNALDDENPWLQAGGIGVSIPIYHGGALRAQVEIATAQQAQAVARYGSVVLAAFREVEDALSNERQLASRLPLDESSFEDRTESVRIATEQYQAGRQDLLWVSNLRSGQIAAEGALIKLRGLQRVNRIRLLLALGGRPDAAPAAIPGSSVPSEPASADG